MLVPSPSSTPLEVAVGTVHRLRLIRVLLASEDPRFRGVAAFLLSRSGFVIETTRRLSRLVELIERRGAHVVILDGSDSPAAAARTAANIRTSHPRVGVLLVTEDLEPRSRRSFDHLPKWGPFEEVVARIERVYVEAARPAAPTEGTVPQERASAPLARDGAGLHEFSNTPHEHASLSSFGAGLGHPATD